MSGRSETDKRAPDERSASGRSDGAAEPASAGLLDQLARYQSFLVPTAAVIVALLIGAALIRSQGIDPWYAYRTIVQAAWFNTDGLLRTLQKATPLVLSGLAVALALKVGLFNIGADGQLLWGAIVAAVVGSSIPGPGFLVIPLCALAGAAAGMLWAGIAGVLKVSRGVHEVISTIMLNAVAAGIIDYLVNGPWRAPGQEFPRSAEIRDAAALPDLGPIPLGFVIAVLLALLAGWTLKRTTLGFRFDTVGKNKWAAEYAGISLPITMVGAMCLSGALAGLAGAIETLGVVHRYEAGSSAGLGFDGITIALLARVNPIATIPAALLVGTLRSGAGELQFDTGIRLEIVDVLLAIILLLVSIPLLARLIFGRRAKSGVALTSGWGA